MFSVFKTIERYEEEKSSDNKVASTIIISIIIIWLLSGLAAFIWSLVCFGRTGTTAQKVIGLLISFFLGPFYWIYFWASSDYCKAR